MEICAITIIALPSKNDLPVGQIMIESNNEIRPILIFVSEVSDGADSGKIMKVKMPVRTKVEIHGNKR
jgi:late competence protein required for DNA uptake (superfamily II DNA/RNA helicase)